MPKILFLIQMKLPDQEKWEDTSVSSSSRDFVIAAMKSGRKALLEEGLQTEFRVVWRKA